MLRPLALLPFVLALPPAARAQPSAVRAQLPPSAAAKVSRARRIDPSRIEAAAVKPAPQPAAQPAAQPTPSRTSVATATLTALSHYVREAQADTSARWLDSNLVFVRVKTPAKMGRAPEGSGLDSGTALDFRIVGTDPATGTAMVLKPWIGAEQGGLRPRAGTRGLFTASVRVGLRDSLNPRTMSPLTPGVLLYLDANADSVTPKELTITESNRYDYRAQVATSIDGDSVDLGVWGIDGVRTTVQLPYIKPRLSISVNPGVAGFGLGVARVVVSVPTGVIAMGDSVAVQLRPTGNGILENPVVYVHGGMTGETRLRSDGTGRDSIIARAEGFGPTGAGIDYRPPIAFIVATLVGTVIGAAMAFFQGRKRPYRQLPRALLVGLPSGVLLAIAVVALGVKLRNFEPAVPGGDALVLFVAALGAYVGAKGLGKLLPSFVTSP